MLAQQVAKKYSRALFNLVRDKSVIDRASTQFEQLNELISADPSLLQFLLAPQVLDSNKESFLKDVFADRLDPLFLEFLLVLVRKHRIGFLPEIIKAFRALVAQEKGIIVALVTSAVALLEKERDALTRSLEEQTGKKIELETKVDPSILGGMIVIMGDQIIDGSVRYSLAQLQDELLKIKVA